MLFFLPRHKYLQNSTSFSGIQNGVLRTKSFNPLNANPEKWSNTLKQIVGNLPTICLNVFDHFMNVACNFIKKEKSDAGLFL